MKHPRRNRKQNKGFSLLEVLVTLAVISVLSIPLIQSFLNSAKVNGKSKSMQNATDIAQNTSEYFKAMSVDVLKSIYNGKYTELSDGKIVFNNIGDGFSTDDAGVSYYKGSDSERFYVSVVLDPAVYSGGGDDSIDGINDYKKPEINHLNESGSVTCMTQINKYDVEGAEAVKAAITASGATFYMEKVYRRVDFFITQSPYVDGRVDYEYKMRVAYGYHGTSMYYLTREMVLSSDTLPKSMEKAPNLYIVYQPTFATYTNSAVKITSLDEIGIYYNNNKTKNSKEKDVNVYIISQDVKNKAGADVVLDKSKVLVKNYYTYASVDDMNKPSDKLKLYTNIPGWKSGNITTGLTNYTKLYNMDVYVWKDIKDGLKVSGSTFTVNEDDCYASLSTVKGE